MAATADMLLQSSREFCIRIHRQSGEGDTGAWLEHLRHQRLPPVTYILQQSHSQLTKVTTPNSTTPYGVVRENLGSSFATENKDGSENRIGGLASRFSVERPCQSVNLRAFPPKAPVRGPEFYLHLNFFLSKEKNYKQVGTKKAQKVKQTNKLEFIDSQTKTLNA